MIFIMTDAHAQSAQNIATTYDPTDIERKWYQIWEEKGYFKPSGQGDSFCIMIPPPNVTGSLHMGHGFNNAIMDALTRYNRMMGKNTLWQPGTDHAGIATQMVVERQLAAQNISRHDLGREQFIDKVWEWKEQSGGTITKQIRRLGSSVDWSRERFTMDDGLSNAVKEVFVKLHEDGLIYRGKRLVNWDPKLQTALSDLEVESVEEKGSLWHFKYFFEDKSLKTQDGHDFLVVATTRPETLLGDTAVAVHPEDERYAHLIGKNIVLPITGRLVPIVADEYVEKDFGTGCVKITPAHDFNDYDLGKRHDLPIINIFNKNAEVLAEFEYIAKAGEQISDAIAAPADYVGLERFAARKKLVAQAEAEGWLDQIQPYDLKAPRGDRSGVIVEPLLTDQWYVKIAPLAQPAIEAVQDGRIKFVPEQYTNMYMAWMNNIQDWCISRQLWWGHRIPAWYDAEGNVYVGRNEEEVRAKNNLAADLALQQDEDVLDTWFSSGLWTFSTLGWTGDAKKDAENYFLNTFHPTDVLVTGFDIIFFWVARMIMMTMHFMKNEDGTPQVPFKTVYVHGLVRDGEGQKMSKSKGNVLDPLDLIDGIDLESLVQKRTFGLMNPKQAEKIEKATRKEFPEGINSYGTDAVRFTFCALANTGRDIKFDLKRVEGYRNFCNKIWNATRFVLMNVEGQTVAQEARPELWELPEQWIMSRLQKAEQAVHQAFATYRLDLAAQTIYDFIWNEYCDWYVELTKPVLNDAEVSEERKAEVRRVLLAVMEASLRLAHPLMPYLTEEIWQTLAPMIGKGGDTIMTAKYPVPEAAKMNEQAEADMQWLQGLIGAVRNIRGEMGLGNARLLPVLLQNISDSERTQIERIQPLFKALAKVESITFLAQGEEPPLSSSSVVGHASVFVPMKGLIDPKAELGRLQKDLDKVQKQHDQIASKLANEGFVAKAPAAVVEGEKVKLAEFADQLVKIKQSMEQIAAL
ncbi:valine--tRNA ligase [Acinetobacter baylyi]|uniref:Valine--tRNA ligase n=4 Tax=Acinetobacter TaxID=469 RepID=SYV_ACIAD|nr:RecName: Full=Valine--tRNA ligase; AltName: Full=Valyl-tRNA synthetase; Short=ValRS [Acinetobacter baylyi ADP1]KAF2372149.1 valine--tRNA ligase [Acinetobacter baylyi]KAF2372473.1 valine--tRNA ligase [Acinetobacter baylyi]KAF2376935.1 valine--tRNA ligase [Acinetobacter baylyi]KAF2379763.1 valine--tRNA ligase [Acinetobacter baylyi]KAF2382100.1 valine--tRNA ligase [Acinetobacter baylyi]